MYDVLCRRLERDTTSSGYIAGVGRSFEREDGMVGGKERTRVREERKEESLETPPSQHIQPDKGRGSNNHFQLQLVSVSLDNPNKSTVVNARSSS